MPDVVGFLETLAGWFGSKPAPVPDVPEQERPATRFSADDPRLPDASRPIVARMLSLIADIEARTQDDSLMVSALAEVRQMRDSHLPRLVSSYA